MSTSGRRSSGPVRGRPARGFALALALLVGVLLFMIAGMAIHTTMAVNQGQGAGGDAEVAWWLARSGLVRAQRELSENSDWATAAPVEQAIPLDDGGGDARYVVRVSRRLVDFNDVWLVTSVGHKGQASRRIVGVIRPDAFSRYSFLTNTEETRLGDPIWFIGGDDIHGPVFTNDRFYLYNNPRLRGTVGSVSDHYVHANGTASEEVEEDETPALTPAPTLEQGFKGDQPYEMTLRDVIGRDEALAELADHADAGGLTFSGNQRVTLKGDSVQVQALNSSGQLTGTPTTYALADLSTRVLYVDGKVEVLGDPALTDGHVDGRLTIAAEEDITITGTIDYRFRKDSDAPADDMLGLCSRENVIIDIDAANAGTSDLTIDSSILALGDEFYYEGNGYDGNPGRARGKLQIYGGVAQVRRGVIGTFNRFGIQSGFTKDYRYDARLASQAPPHFPNLVQQERRKLVTVIIRDLQSLSAQP